jgi:hypothetical protein
MSIIKPLVKYTIVCLFIIKSLTLSVVKYGSHSKKIFFLVYVLSILIRMYEAQSVNRKEEPKFSKVRSLL